MQSAVSILYHVPLTAGPLMITGFQSRFFWSTLMSLNCRCIVALSPVCEWVNVNIFLLATSLYKSNFVNVNINMFTEVNRRWRQLSSQENTTKLQNNVENLTEW